jgi:F-type H+-transporting ATPase subunit b
MQLVPDYTLVIQIVAFVVLWAALKRLVFEPIMDALDARNERTAAVRAEAERLVAAAQEARHDYEKSLHDARAQMVQEAARARGAAQEEAGRALAETREAANEELRRLRADVAKQVEDARRSLAAQADEIAHEMLGRVTAGASQ